MKIIVNNTEYEIQTIVYHKQCDAFYKALKDKDSYKAHMLFIPPTHLSQYLINAKIKTIMLKEKYKAEMRRIDEMLPEMLKIEIKLKLNKCVGK